MKKVVVLLSGGMDSATLLHFYKDAGDRVRAISFNYGQRHSNEVNFAITLAKDLDVPLAVVDLSSLAHVLPGSSQTDRRIPVPQGRYDEENMKATVVPNRNMILLSVAIGHAIAYQCDAVAYAAHAGDHAIYPDCRPEFAEAMEVAAKRCHFIPIQLLRPFIRMTKAEIASMGDEMGVDFAKTWSCYEGKDVHCGRCGTCIERREAFFLARIKDPTVYHPNAPSVGDLVRSNWHLPA